jgi:hypothetical protein
VTEEIGERIAPEEIMEDADERPEFVPKMPRSPWGSKTESACWREVVLWEDKDHRREPYPEHARFLEFGRDKDHWRFAS